MEKKKSNVIFNTYNHLTSFKTYKVSSSNLIYEQKKLYKNINNNLRTKFYNKLIKKILKSLFNITFLPTTIIFG